MHIRPLPLAATTGVVAAALALGLGAAPAAAQADPTERVVEGPDTTAIVDFLRAPTLQERWAEPFSVEATGRVAPRPPRGEVVWVGPGAPVRAAPAAPPAPPAPPASRAEPPAGPEPPPAREPPAPPAGAPTHTVAAGETFYGIARAYGVTVAQLRALNPHVDWDRLRMGEVLAIPVTRAASAPAVPPAAPETGSRTHQVQPGETLYGIARRYGVGVEAIREANRMETDQVRAGQRLWIPAP
jgi:LysM repeat protein